MSEKSITSRYVDEVYDQSSHYIVIGLTGRCGSGCSTAMDILCNNDKFSPEELLGNHQPDPIHNSDRDRNIILNYAIKNRIEFEAIKVRDILTGFILEKSENFFSLLNDMYKEQKGDSIKIKSDFYDYFHLHYDSDTRHEDFDGITNTCKRIWDSINENVYNFIENITQNDYEFLFDNLSRIGDVIRNFLIDSFDKNTYTAVYQHIGNIVRTYGFLEIPHEENNDAILNGKDMHSIARRINLLIKIKRRKEWILNNYNKQPSERVKPIRKSNVYIVIDSIKNVFEANYLRSRYNSFFLVAMTLDDESRIQHLKFKKNLSPIEIDTIDAREQPSKAKRILSNANNSELYEILFSDHTKGSKLFKKSYTDDSYIFKMQDVDSCIQNADILINNGGTMEELSLKLIRYVCLMQHPGLVPPTTDEKCMQVAQSAKLNSGCISRRVGAVVSDSAGNILTVGWNDPAATAGNECISCARRSFDKIVQQDDEQAYSYYELFNPEYRDILTCIMKKHIKEDSNLEDRELFNKFMEKTKPLCHGLPLAFCFKDIYSSLKGERNQVHTRAQHAEENALELCDRGKCKEGTLYTTSSSCELCAKKALSYDIRRIVYIEPYSGITNNHILGHMVENGVKIRRDKITRTESIKVELFTGATQNAYVKLYTPLFPMKDELRLRGIDLQ